MHRERITRESMDSVRDAGGAWRALHGSGTRRPRRRVNDAWIDVTATLDPATTPVYEGDAPMTFEFLWTCAEATR